MKKGACAAVTIALVVAGHAPDAGARNMPAGQGDALPIGHSYAPRSSGTTGLRYS